MGYEVTPEPGEQFALVGDAEILNKGFGSQPKKGALVLTDRRLAFKGRLKLRSAFHLIAHAAGKGQTDISIPYSAIKEVNRVKGIGGYHFKIVYSDHSKGEDRTLKVKLDRWGKAGDIAGNALDFVPVVGDFLSLGANLAQWRSGSTAANTWVETIRKSL